MFMNLLVLFVLKLICKFILFVGENRGASSSHRAAETSNPRQVSLNFHQRKEESLVQALPFRFPEDSMQMSS